MLQKQGKVMKDWNLDIYYRDPTIIADVIIEKIEPFSPAITYGTHTISIVVEPASIKGYAIPIIFLDSEEEAIALLDTVQAYLKLRYGV